MNNIFSFQAPTFKPCPRNSQKYSDCVINAIQKLKPQIATGIYGPDLIIGTNLTKLVIGDVSVNQNFNLKLTGLYALGLKDFTLHKLRINPENFKVSFIKGPPRLFRGHSDPPLASSCQVFFICWCSVTQSFCGGFLGIHLYLPLDVHTKKPYSSGYVFGSQITFNMGVRSGFLGLHLHQPWVRAGVYQKTHP